MIDAEVSLPLRERLFLFVQGKTGFSALDLQSKRRPAELVEARALFVWLARWTKPDISYPALGRWLGGRDHTTIMHECRKAESLLLRDPDFARNCEDWKALSRSRGDIHACH